MDCASIRVRLPRFSRLARALCGALALCALPAFAAPFSFSNGDVNGQIGMASRPESAGKIEIETGDDFIAGSGVRIDRVTFTGLITGNVTPADIGHVVTEIYRIFPKDSTNPPSGNVPTRVNSPSDVAFQTRDSGAGELNFTVSTLSNSFTAGNSVLNGIRPSPNQTTGGEGPITGTEVLIDVTLSNPFTLPPDHYFFIPQVEVNGGEFFWLSSVRPIVAPGTPFTPDLQTWIRDQNLDPDWLRVGTDVIGAGTFNAAFTLAGVTVPEPATLALLGLGAVLGGAVRRYRRPV